MNHPAKPAVALQDAPLDPLDIGVQLDDLRGLEDGWLFGNDGKALCGKGLDWLEEAFRLHYTGKAPPPYLYPTAEGGVSAEWRIKPFYISLEIDLATKEAYWHSTDMVKIESEEEDIILTDEAGWQWLVNSIREKSPQIRAD